MYMATGALLLWAVATAGSRWPWTKTTYPIPNHARPCNVTIENGYVNAVCKIVMLSTQEGFVIGESPNALTIEELLVSNETVGQETAVNDSVHLSLRSVKIRKWDNFRKENGDNHLAWNTGKCKLGGPEGNFCEQYPAVIRRITIKTAFGEPLPDTSAVAVCTETQGGRGCNFEVRAFINSVWFDSWYFFIARGVMLFLKKSYAKTDVLNVTLADAVRNVPNSMFFSMEASHIKHIIFYNCKIDNITKSSLPRIIHLERLEFFHTPIKEIELEAFILNPHIRYCSFVGTNLRGIPQAISDLKRLETLDMSDTNLPPDIKFQYCPGNCESNSSVKQLILSRTNLISLPDRAFCGFPLLEGLELENCNITQLSGSPFECLENLKNLTVSDNEIRSLDRENMKGLRNLTFLNLSKNRIAHFDGQQIFSTLISLRSLVLSQNKITNLLLGPVEHAPIEHLNLVDSGITGWKPPLFIRMDKLEALLLQDNGLSSLSEDMLHDISHVKYVNFSSNPWDCSSCELKNLRTLLDKHPSNCTKCFLCKKPDEHEGRSVLEAPLNDDYCGPPDYFRSHGIPSILFIMFSSIVGYAVYRNRWYCMYGMLYLKVAVKGRRRQAQDEHFNWDGFLSYHASDAGWVRDVLLPKLESAPMGFKFCVAERNFVPGVPITENICRAIAESRVSLFVLSQEFCHSRWCMFELNLAQHRLFENDRHDSLVLIKKNDLEVSEMSSMLAYLIKSRTYVQLPPEGSNEALYNLFWLQVQAALEK